MAMKALIQLDPADLDSLLAMDAAQRLGAIIRMNAAHRYPVPLDALGILAWLHDLDLESPERLAPPGSSGAGSEAGFPVSSGSVVPGPEPAGRFVVSTNKRKP